MGGNIKYESYLISPSTIHTLGPQNKILNIFNANREVQARKLLLKLTTLRTLWSSEIASGYKNDGWMDSVGSVPTFLCVQNLRSRLTVKFPIFRAELDAAFSLVIRQMENKNNSFHRVSIKFTVTRSAASRRSLYILNSKKKTQTKHALLSAIIVRTLKNHNSWSLYHEVTFEPDIYSRKKKTKFLPSFCPLLMWTG